MKLTYPYEIQIDTPEEAAAYIQNQCNRCPRHSANWECAGYVAAKCCDVAESVAAYFKAKSEKQVQNLQK